MCKDGQYRGHRSEAVGLVLSFSTFIGTSHPRRLLLVSRAGRRIVKKMGERRKWDVLIGSGARVHFLNAFHCSRDI
jgi:dihydroxyacid dehydratase/phosphogluconate dehydratase